MADTTYIPTWAGFGDPAVVLDVFGRKVVGWAFSQRQTADLALAAPNMALQTRRPESGVIHHSDQGSIYTSLAFGKRCSGVGMRPSMGSVGDAYDNVCDRELLQLLAFFGRRATSVDLAYPSTARRSSLRRIFPTGDFGSASVKMMRRGRL